MRSHAILCDPMGLHGIAHNRMQFREIAFLRKLYVYDCQNF